MSAAGKFEQAQGVLKARLSQTPIGPESQPLQAALVKLHLAWGRKLEAAGDLAGALTHFVQVYQKDDLASAPTTAARLGHIVELAQKLNRNEDVVTYATRALPLYQKPVDKPSRAWLQGCIGLANVNLGQNDKAIAPLQSAFLLYQELGDTAGSALAQYYAGRALVGLFRTDDALATLQAGQELYQKLGNKSGVANTTRFIGVVYRQTHRSDEALAAFQSIIPIYQELGDKAGEGLTLSALGLTYREVGRFREGLATSQAALPLLQAGNEKAVEAQTTEDIKETQEAITKYEKLFPGEKIEGFTDDYPKPTDDNATKADKAKQLAAKGSKLSNGGDRTLSVPLFYNASLTFHELGDTKNEAYVLHRLALDYRGLKRYDESLLTGMQELAMHRDLKDGRMEGRALFNIALCYQRTNQTNEALTYYTQALPKLHAAREIKNEADVRANIGKLDLAKSSYTVIITLCQQQIAIYHELGKTYDEALELRTLAQCYEEFGRADEALKCRMKALPLFQGAKGKEKLAEYYEDQQIRWISMDYSKLGNWDETMRYSQISLDNARKSGDKTRENRAIFHLAWMTREQTKFQESIDYYLQALDYFQHQKMTWEAAAAHLYLGETCVDLLDQNAAKAQAGAQTEKNEVVAPNAAVQAVGITNAAPTNAVPTNAVPTKAASMDQEALLKEAFSQLSQALEQARKLRWQPEQARAMAGLMRVYAYRKQRELAIIVGKEAVNIYQTLRSSNADADNDTKESYVKMIGPTYKSLARLLIDSGRFVEAEEVLAMIQQDEFLQFVQRSARGPQVENVRAEFTPKEKPVVAEHDDKLASVVKLSAEEWELRDLNPRTPEQEARFTVVKRLLNEAQTQLDHFYASMPVRFKRNEKDVIADRNQTSVIQPLLADMGGHVAQISTFLDDDALDMVLTMPSGPTLNLSFPAKDAPTGGKPFPEWLNGRIFEFVQAIQTGAHEDNTEDVNNRATELNNILTCHGALHHQLKEAGITTLMWRLQGPLRSLPLAALRDGDGYWAEKYQNVLLTAGSSDLNLTHKPASTWKALGLGVTQSWTVEGDQFPALSGVKSELKAVVNAPEDGFTGGALTGRVLEDKNFTEAAFFRSLRGKTPTSPTPWQVIHFASHFKLSADDLKSFLLLGDGTPLTMADLQERAKDHPLFPGVELITLSACQTAQGTDSLGALAEINGAKSVIATLWPVADKETVQIMADFYQSHAKISDKNKAWALQHAQLQLIHSGKASARPYFWAPFILMGNWQ